MLSVIHIQGFVNNSHKSAGGADEVVEITGSRHSDFSCGAHVELLTPVKLFELFWLFEWRVPGLCRHMDLKP